MKIEISDIEKVEHLLLPHGCCFDIERRNFISDMSTMDLLAVPGSGKTTALIAKLYCIAQKMPLKKGKGILVLSHTNAAIDEIKNKLGNYVPQLFDYPNAICTVQDFIDTFLAIPFYKSVYKHNIIRIDDEVYTNSLSQRLKLNNRGCIAYYKNRDINFFIDARFNYNEKGERILTRGITGAQLKIKEIGAWKKNGLMIKNELEILRFVKNVKANLMQNGILHYDDCYFLATSYLRKFPLIKEFIRERFPYVFVDETQDLQSYQLDIIDSIFKESACIIQRVGDINQSIYNEKVDNLVCQWHPRNICTLNNSLRLTNKIGDIVNAFMLYRDKNKNTQEAYQVKGIRFSKKTIPPYLILFDKGSIYKIRSCFVSLIKKYELENTKEGKEYGFHIIGWNAKKTNNLHKMHLEDYFGFRNSNSGKNNFTCLAEYIQCSENTFRSIRKSILKSFCHILYIANKHDEKGRLFSISSMNEQIKNYNNGEIMNDYLHCLYNVSKKIISKDYASAYISIKSFIFEKFLTCFRITLNDTIRMFIGTEFVEDPQNKKTKRVESQEPHIDISTVHSVKGTTHCATMYIETFYEGEYESGHLFKIKKKATKKRPIEYYKNPLLNEKVDSEKLGVYAKQAIRMMYVGFSRPTHLLCYATWKSNWNDTTLQKMKDIGWEIEDLTI